MIANANRVTPPPIRTGRGGAKYESTGTIVASAIANGTVNNGCNLSPMINSPSAPIELHTSSATSAASSTALTRNVPRFVRAEITSMAAATRDGSKKYGENPGRRIAASIPNPDSHSHTAIVETAAGANPETSRVDAPSANASAVRNAAA